MTTLQRKHHHTIQDIVDYDKDDDTYRHIAHNETFTHTHKVTNHDNEVDLEQAVYAECHSHEDYNIYDVCLLYTSPSPRDS